MTMAISPISGLVFSSAAVGGMNAARFDNFLTQVRRNLDPEEGVIFVFDGAPAHRNAVIAAPNTELKMPPSKVLSSTRGAGHKLTIFLNLINIIITKSRHCVSYH